MLSSSLRTHKIPKQKAWQDCNKQGKSHKKHKIGYLRSAWRQRSNGDKSKKFQRQKTKQQQQQQNPRQTKQELKCPQRSESEQTLNTSRASRLDLERLQSSENKQANKRPTTCLDQNASKANKQNMPYNKNSKNKPKPERYLLNRTLK